MKGKLYELWIYLKFILAVLFSLIFLGFGIIGIYISLIDSEDRSILIVPAFFIILGLILMRVAIKSWKPTLQHLKQAKLEAQKTFAETQIKMSEDRNKYKKKMQEIKKTHSEIQAQYEQGTDKKLKELNDKDRLFQNDLRDCDKFGIKVGFWEKFLGRLNQNNQIQLAEEKKNLESKKRAAARKRKEKLEKMNSLLEKYSSSLSENIISSFNEDSITVGMPIEMVDFIEGQRYEEKKGASSGTQTLRCNYGRNGRNQRGNYIYKLEVVFENDVVRSYKEL